MALTPEDVPATPVPDGTADAGWLRVHPASPFVRGWVALAAMLFFFGRDSFERLLQGGPLFDERLAGRAPWLLLGGGALLLLTVLGYVLSWYFTRYQVAGGYVRVNTGFLFKQQRQARLDRVQAIDVVQPLLARIFGLAELQVRSRRRRRIRRAPRLPARGRGPAAPRDNPGPRLRRSGRRWRRSPGPARRAGAAAAEAPEQAVLTVPPPRLVGSLLLSEQSVAIAGRRHCLGDALRRHRKPELHGLPDPRRDRARRRLLELVQQGLQLHRRHSPDGIRLRYGLLDTQAQTLPPGRIQALKVSQPPLWRMFGWYRIQVNVAGYGVAGSAGEGSARTTLLPVGTLAEVLEILALVIPDPGTPDPGGVHGGITVSRTPETGSPAGPATG